MTVLQRTDAADPADTAPLQAHSGQSLASVRAEDWDALVAEANGALRHGYLLAWEQVELRGLRSRPVLAYSGQSSRPAAACPGYLYDLDVLTARWPQGGPVASALRRVWPGFLLARTYELGSPIPLTNPFLVKDPARRPEAVHALISAATAEAERARAELILVQNFPSVVSPAGEELARLGFTSIPMPPTAVVDLSYASFDDYLAAMRAQYRRRAQTTIKRSGHLRVEHRARFADLAEELARLYRAVYDRAHEVKREVLTAAFFRHASALERTSVLLLLRPDGSIASYALLLSHLPWLSFLQCGFEEEAGRGEAAYFRLLYEIVRVAIEGGYEHVDLGLTTLVPKLDVGAVPVPLYAWLRHRNPVLHRIIGGLGRGPLRPEPTQARRVFKQAPPSPEELAQRRAATL